MTTFAKRKRTRIGTWNVRTLYQTGKLAQLAAEAGRLNITILGLSETRWTDFGEKKLASGQIFLYSGLRGNKPPHEKGVGFLLSPLASKGLMEWHPVSERIISARFKSRIRNVTIIQCYAPTEMTQYAEKEAFYDQLTLAINSVPKKDICIMMGDLNAQIGPDNKQIEHIMGKHALGSMTENGELFTEFCGIHDLVIGGSLFPHKRSHKVTWVSPDLVTENQIDHICIARQFRRSLQDVRNKRSADIGSDHHLLLGEIRFCLRRAFPHREKIGKRFNTKRLKYPEVRAAFVAELQSNLANNSVDYDDINAQWNNIKTAHISTSDKVLGVLQPDRKEWMLDPTWEKVEQRRAAKAAINVARTRNGKMIATQKWHQINKEVKKLCKQDRNKWANDLADEAEHAARTGNLRTLYDTTKRLSGRPAPSVPIKDKNGKLLTNEMDQLKRWHEHFVELFSIPHDEELPDNFSPPPVPRIQRVNTAAPTVREIEEAILSMKDNKAPGIDQITAEMLKADSQLSAQTLYPVFKHIWENETFPEDWMQGILVKVPKKGNPSDCDNWRGIMLLCCPVKIFCRVILNRIDKKVDETLREAQAGFRPGRSCVDHINTLRIIIEQVAELQNTLHLVFVDFKKAFDMLLHHNIWKTMKRKGIPDKLINLIKAQYTNFMCRVLHKGNLSDPIECKSGVRQGCILSPLLFLLVIDEVLASLDGNKTGIQWSLRSNDHLEDLDFADDIALLATKRSAMQNKLTTLQNNAEKVGLKINIGKTKSMQVGAQTPASFEIDGIPIERVENFTYLGSQMTPDGGAREDVKSRIRKAQCAFGQLKSIWKSKQLSLKTKIRIFNSNVKSVLLYGCETWLVAEDVTRKLQVFVNRCLRRILQIFWPNTISNHDLHHKCNQDLIENEIRRRKWGWIGHTLRRDPNNIARQALDWNPQGQRRRGAPRRTWKRSLDTEIQKIDKDCTWKKVKAMATNRRLWRETVSHLCD